jgi:hypothetical protein
MGYLVGGRLAWSRRLADWYGACWLGLVGLMIPSVMGVRVQGLESAEVL